MAQASASKIRRRVRERGQVARFIARDFEGSHLYGVRLTHIIQGRACFDVHAAREAAEALVRLEAEQAVFEDWARERGLGPENREPGAFGGLCPGEVIRVRDDGVTEMRPCWESPTCDHRHAERGGWPGKLAREYAWNRCPNACEVRVVTFGLGPERDTRARCRVRPDGKICDCIDGRVRHQGRDPRAAMGRALARLGRRVLAAIEGQPSECQAQGCPFAVTSRPPTPCPDCNGTGHNLRGTLPAVEWSVAQRARASDGAHAAWNEGTGDPRKPGPTSACDPVQALVLGHERRHHPPSPSFATKTTGGTPLDNHMGLTGFARLAFVERTLGAGDLTGELSRRFHTARSDTRVVPRGEHRIGPARGKDDPPWTLDQRINGRGWAPESKREAAEDMRLIFACSPAWRRGEVHAFVTRRRRAWEAVGEEWEGQWWMPPAGTEAAE